MPLVKTKNNMYARKVEFLLITKSSRWTADGCASWSIFNHGNVNVTINGVQVLRPGQGLTGPDEHPEIRDYSDIDFQFDKRNSPKVVQPDTGTDPTPKSYDPTIDPLPSKDFRVVLMKTYISKI
jgi:hypothetical protein